MWNKQRSFVMEVYKLISLAVVFAVCFSFDNISVYGNKEKESGSTANVTKPPEEVADLFEGDIKLDKDLLHKLFPNPDKASDAILSLTRHWPGGVVPYVIDSSLTGTTQRQKIFEAIEQYNKHTCIKFIPYTNENHYLKFFSGSGCYSYIGRTLDAQGYQELSLGSGCTVLGTVIHEMMHALGFFHEQSRLDRDDYVTIMWNNIRSGKQHNFKKYSRGEADLLGTKYDYKSVMHYPDWAFRKSSGLKTIIPKDSTAAIGQRIGFSKSDIRQINILYKCDKPGCRDNSSTCSDHKTNGHCDKSSPSFPLMKTLCPYTCDLCHLFENCTDNSARCYYYHSKGYCATHEVVRQNCPLTCGECDISKCADKRQRSCPYFKNKGYCDKSSSFYAKMIEFCPMTCGLCI